MRSEIEIRVTIMIMGVISILILSGTVMNTLAAGTAVNANVKVKSAMYLGKLTKFTSLNADISDIIAYELNRIFLNFP